MKVIQIYRILQELITNTLRHAQATTMRIRMQYQKRSLVIHVEDDGKGYDPRELSNAGIGLRNIQGRLQTLNARWENLSAPDQGAAYRIEIPLPRKKA
jgi:signal transduction histidine kinase